MLCCLQEWPNLANSRLRLFYTLQSRFSLPDIYCSTFSSSFFSCGKSKGGSGFPSPLSDPPPPPLPQIAQSNEQQEHGEGGEGNNKTGDGRTEKKRRGGAALNKWTNGLTVPPQTGGGRGGGNCSGEKKRKMSGKDVATKFRARSVFRKGFSE